jgi:hypothetical protein
MARRWKQARQVPPFQTFPSPCLRGGQKGWLRRLHFMRPFAPCFSRLVAGAQVYLLSTSYSDITAAVCRKTCSHPLQNFSIISTSR